MANELNSSKSDVNEQRAALNRAIDTASAAPDESEDGYVIKRLSEALADIVVTIRGDDAPLAGEPTNPIEKAKRAAQVLRLEVELYRSQALAAAPAAASVPFNLLAEPHTGMRGNYSGMLKWARRSLGIGMRDSESAEMLRQFCDHLTELGQRWYGGDTAVVDELLPCPFCGCDLDARWNRRNPMGWPPRKPDTR